MEVTKINYKNNEYTLDGVELADALKMLEIDESTVDMEVEGDTLYIMAKAGSKGADSLEDNDEVADNEKAPISLAEMKKHPKPIRHKVTLIDGKLIEIEDDEEEDNEYFYSNDKYDEDYDCIYCIAKKHNEENHEDHDEEQEEHQNYIMELFDDVYKEIEQLSKRVDSLAKFLKI